MVGAAGQDRDKVGGITLDAAMMSFQIKRDKNGTVLPVSAQLLSQANRISGFTPRIVNVELANLPKLMGIE